MGTHLDQLEDQSVYILREAYKHFRSLGMLWSIGKDSTVMLWLARKAFLGHVPFPLIHIDTNFKIPAMIQYRDRVAREWGLEMVVGQNKEALAEGMNHTRGRLNCCRALKTEALIHTLDGSWPRLRMGRDGEYREEVNGEAFTGVIVGPERMKKAAALRSGISLRANHNADWDVADQPPELWSQYKTEFAPGTHVRIHPLLDWTEINIWEYIERENIPIIDLYFDKGDGIRYRSIGCGPCTGNIKSPAKTPQEIIVELRVTTVPERAGRAQDQEDPYAMEKLRREGYM